MNDDRLTRLLGEKDRLQAAMVPLTERLARCDAALGRMDRALGLRDQLLTEHDRAVAGAIADGRSPPEMNPALNLAEIDLRKASGEARAAAMARGAIIEEIAALNAQLSDVGSQLEEQTWLAVPAAAAPLFAAAESAQVTLTACLAALDSVIGYAHEQAYQRAQNGAPPESTPAFRCWLRFRAMTANLTANLGANAVRDFKTGPELLKAISEGRAELGDVSRFEPRSQALPDGSIHINRAQPPAEPVGAELPDPAALVPAAEGNQAAPEPPGALVAGELLAWLEPSSPTFMPAPRGVG
jgi:hypothetical protein